MAVPRTDVPPDDVGEVVQDFVDDDVEHIDVKKQPDGNFTITPLPQ